MTEQHANRLIHEQSPYLLQHAHNPVDWMPWGEEAFARARNEDKPIFLSIGYSTCHWCHVMERESFEDDEVAAMLNRSFVSIKVDREERPDVDQFYMSVCQAMNGSGGWPLSVFLTPEKKPFFAGTYFPKSQRYGRPGMLELLASIVNLWTTQREQLIASAGDITKGIQGSARQESVAGGLSEKTLELAYRQLSRAFEPAYGGFSTRPKFPSPHNFLFLLRYAKRSGDTHAIEMIEKTLQNMRMGGIFDQIGFGYHRYSTDERWLVPHFEKMLYDQAMMIMAFAEMFQRTQQTEYATNAREVIEYVLRDMTSPEGGFYSAEDADSEGIEGKFYLWTTEEVRALLSAEEAELFIRVFNLQEDGNFHDEATGETMRTNIPHLSKPLAVLAQDEAMTEEELRARLEPIRRKLFDAREKRVHPLKDDKILTDWNGLMIAALAKTAQALHDHTFGAAAIRACQFALNHLQDENGRLYKRYRNGRAALTGMLDDYAFLVWGLIEAYEYAFDPHLLAAAIDMTETMLAHFWDEENGGLFLSPDDREALPVRAKDAYDGAVPSGNSVAAYNLLRLARMTGNTEWEVKAHQIFDAFAGEVADRPIGNTLMMSALDFSIGPAAEIVIATDANSTAARQMLTVLRSQYLPNAVILWKGNQLAEDLAALAPFTREQTPVNDEATVYVCKDFACQAPLTSAEELQRALTNL